VKECLVATSLKLQVAAKALENDEVTIKHLRKDLVDAQQKSEEAISKQVIAADLIQALRLEIIQLNRRMKDQMSGEDVTHSIPQSAIFQEADNQVEQLMFKKGIQFQSSSLMAPPSLKVNHVKEPRGNNRPSDFQEWKMKKFLWAPDTPAGSENHDEEVVSELLQATLHPPQGTGILRKNTAAIAKQRIHSFKLSEHEHEKKTTTATKTLPSVKSFSKKHNNPKKKVNMNMAQTMNDDDFLREFKNTTMANLQKERPKTTQRF
jgi:hypothetical protein